jgi:predicted pyridoxine 5'-phosphate oxidase superfamily flavin-nucleotide-binding protein
MTNDQKEFLKANPLVILATADKSCQPRAIFVEAEVLDSGELLITDNEMAVTTQNLLENQKVFILAFDKDYKHILKIIGNCRYHTEGEYLDLAKSLLANAKYRPKGAVVIEIEEGLS